MLCTQLCAHVQVFLYDTFLEVELLSQGSLFTQQMPNEHVLYTKHCSRWWTTVILLGVRSLSS